MKILANVMLVATVIGLIVMIAVAPVAPWVVMSWLGFYGMTFLVALKAGY